MSSARSEKRKGIMTEGLFIAIAVTASVILLGVTLSIRIDTAVQNDINLSLSERLDELEDENTRLTIVVNTRFSLEEIENAARNEFGMLQKGSERYTEIEIEKEDRAVILGDAVEGSTFLKSWIGSISNIFPIGK